jgi:hypothetical protein
VAERSETKVCFSSLAGIAGSIPSQWPSRLRRRSVADSLLGLRVRILPMAWLFVLCVVSRDKEVRRRRTGTRKVVRINYKPTTRECKHPAGSMDMLLLCVVS